MKFHYVYEVPMGDGLPDTVYVSACVQFWIDPNRYGYTKTKSEVTCGNCRRTKAFKEATS